MKSDAIQTKKISNCLLCQNEGKLLYRDLNDRLYGVPGVWSHYRCDCGLVWLNPTPILEDIPKCYPQNYFTHTRVSSPNLGASSTTKLLRYMALSSCLGYKHLKPDLWYASLLGRLIMLTPFGREKATMGLGALLPPYQAGGRLLDIGCGNGYYLAVMKELGWEVAGIEIDPKAAEVAKSRFDILVHQGNLENAPFDDRSFDVITMSHVIEHIPDPIRFIINAAKLLKPSGQMVIITPNVQSLGHKVFSQKWYPLDPPRHLLIFTPETLKQCLVKSGLFHQINLSTTTRILPKVFRKFFLLKKTGSYSPPSQTIPIPLGIRVKTEALHLIEKLGNKIFQWGEEIECTAKKQ